MSPVGGVSERSTSAVRSGMTPVAVIGTGLLGRGIAEVVLRAGLPVILHDTQSVALAQACEALRSAVPAAAARVHTQAVLEQAAREAGIVIEAIVEDLRVKQQVFARLDAANPDAVLMSNSSVLPITQIAMLTMRPERAVGTHWWNPPQLIPVVEVIRGQRTAPEIMQRTVDFLVALGKTPVRVERDVPGFVGNRLQHALWREALALVSDGICPPESVDRIVAATLGVSLAERGPIAEMRRAGAHEVARELADTLPGVNSDPGPARLLREKVAEGQLGAKTGQGLLLWPPGARERAAERLRTHLERRLGRAAGDCAPVAAPPLSVADRQIARRLRCALWREALALVEGGVCAAETVDLMALKTIGLRLAAMGPVENADYVGLDLTLAIHEAVLPSLAAGLSPPQRLDDLISAGAPPSGPQAGGHSPHSAIPDPS